MSVELARSSRQGLKPRPHGRAVPGGHEGTAPHWAICPRKSAKCLLKQPSKARAMPVVLKSRVNDGAARRTARFLCSIDGNVMELNKGKVL